MIVTDIEKLKVPCESVVDKSEGEKIAIKLFRALANEEGIGLSANQIGINKKVCVLQVPKSVGQYGKDDEPIYLVNPRIVEKSDKIVPYTEGCLSFPEKTIRTLRHVSVLVEADNHEGQLYFCPRDDNDPDDWGLLESVCVQHEIDHLNGITMFDREHKLQPIKKEKKYGRNEKITITNPGTKEKIENIKYKKAEIYIEQGWEVL